MVATTPLRVSVLRRSLLRLRVLGLAVLLLLGRPMEQLEPGVRWPVPVQC